MKSMLTSLSLLTLLAAPALAQDQAPPAPWEPWNANVPGGNYLAPWLTLQQQLPAYSNTPMHTSALEHLGFYQSFVGDYAGAVASFDAILDLEQRNGWGQVDWRACCKPLPAVATILAEAGKRQAVFINEAHHVPLHRAFTTQLLSGLYAKGYRYFAAEALGEDAELAQRGYPLRGQSGSYTDEPVFAEMVRTALKLGYRLVPYEDTRQCDQSPGQTEDCGTQRERNQALNLQQRIFAQDPEARVLVHAGYGHIEELAAESWKPMGHFFKEFTGIDPLSLDQVEMTEHSAARFESPFYANTLAHDPIKVPTLYLKPDGSFWTGFYKGNYDALIVHPRSRYSQGRPDWLLQGRKLQSLPADLCPAPPCLVQASLASESEDTVPRDQILLRDQAPKALALPPGSYRIGVRDASGAVIKNYGMEVK